MRRSPRSDRGETLIEVLISIVLIGVVVTALFSTIVATTHATQGQRYVVSADAVLRDSAELTKDAVRHDCSSTSTTYSVDYESLASGGVTPPPNVSNAPCPPAVGDLPVLTLTVTFPSPGEDDPPVIISKSLEMVVRTP